MPNFHQLSRHVIIAQNCQVFFYLFRYFVVKCRRGIAEELLLTRLSFLVFVQGDCNKCVQVCVCVQRFGGKGKAVRAVCI